MLVCGVVMAVFAAVS